MERLADISDLSFLIWNKKISKFKFSLYYLDFNSCDKIKRGEN